MKKVAFVTYAAAPYRIKQFEEFSKYAEIHAYYISEKMIDRSWNLAGDRNFKEEKLQVAYRVKGIGAIHKNLKKIAKENDIVIIGGYSSPTYILLSILCKLYKTPSVVLLDGISPKKLNENGNGMKNLIKKMVLRNSSAVFGNGTVAKTYFQQVLKYKKKVYPQVLTSNVEAIMELSSQKKMLKSNLYEKYGIDSTNRIISYSGRLLPQKNVKDIIDALVLLNQSEIYFMIFGGGTPEQEKELIDYAKMNNISMKITGFIQNQDELYKHYYMSDLFILPSMDDAWGLVVNEAMAAGLPVIVSDGCGCSLDLIDEGKNGYVYSAGNVEELSERISLSLNENNLAEMGECSIEMIHHWTFAESGLSFKKMITEILN